MDEGRYGLRGGMAAKKTEQVGRRSGKRGNGQEGFFHYMARRKRIKRGAGLGFHRRRGETQREGGGGVGGGGGGGG